MRKRVPQKSPPDRVACSRVAEKKPYRMTKAGYQVRSSASGQLSGRRWLARTISRPATT